MLRLVMEARRCKNFTLVLLGGEMTDPEHEKMTEEQLMLISERHSTCCYSNKSGNTPKNTF